MGQKSVCATYNNNSLLASLLGEHNRNLHNIEKSFSVIASSRGNVIAISGKSKQIEMAKACLDLLYNQLEMGMEIAPSDVEAAIRMVADQENYKTEPDISNEIIIKTPLKQIRPYSNKQKQYVQTLFNSDMVFCNGPAGTGKSYLAVAVAVSLFLNHKVDRIILSRPALEAGEKIGFLPGDMKEKIDPYLRPLYDALYSMLPFETVNKYIETNVIEIAPLGFMRGRTLSNAFIILDEAQNTTPGQLKMFITRLGENSKMAINGDLTQIDLPRGEVSGLIDATTKLRKIKEIQFIEFDQKDVVRNKLVSKIISAYEGS